MIKHEPLVIVSDLHLTHHFDERLFRFLYNLFSRSDQLVLNGDIWDGFHTDWSRFTSSHWKHLFPLLRRKQAHYLFGNHDPEHWTPEPWLLSTQWGQELDLPWNNKTLHVEHGHRLGASFDILHPFLARALRNVVPYRRWTFKDVAWNRRTDAAMRQGAQMEFHPERLMLVGHSHIPGVDESLGYYNSGFIQDGKASWLETVGDKLILKHSSF